MICTSLSTHAFKLIDQLGRQKFKDTMVTQRLKLTLILLDAITNLSYTFNTNLINKDSTYKIINLITFRDAL